MLQREQGLALLCISHDLEFLAEFAPEIALMRQGAIVEQGTMVRRYIPAETVRQSPAKGAGLGGGPVGGLGAGLVGGLGAGLVGGLDPGLGPGAGSGQAVA
jgi:hypothetical protein